MKPALLPSILLACVLALPVTVGAVETGARWLQAELPAHVNLQTAACEQLAAAVGKATLVHQPQAPAILRAALTRGSRSPERGEGAKLPCACAQRIFGVSVAAAPSQASALLDLVTALYPACAADFVGVMRDYDRLDYDSKDRRSDKNVAGGVNAPARGTTTAPSDPAAVASNQPNFDPGTDVQNRGDLSDQDITGMGFGDINGFGTGGISAGFPGSPSFVGSPPDGGLAFPPTPVTAAVNG